jgi:hypothetical protein
MGFNALLYVSARLAAACERAPALAAICQIPATYGFLVTLFSTPCCMVLSALLQPVSVSLLALFVILSTDLAAFSICCSL